jgi:UDP-N-acetylglucosamine:LPS N-acetylglucosamine transferase
MCFASVYRTILENDLIGVWIRRGLWQPTQITPLALQREAVFRRVIVPREAFDELNEDYSFGPRICPVGPIVQQVAQSPRETAALRRRLMRQFGRTAEELVVTMLGGGVAADRLAQSLVACGAAERRPGCLHLVVVWPGSRVPPALLGWKNSVVVQTRHAARLCLAADLVISAAGYNSFHECLYHAVPAIFVPQMAPFMDDQSRRARAASDRGLAETVPADELLRLDREIGLFLDHGKAADIRARLAATVLPARGTAAAAALIGELAR